MYMYMYTYTHTHLQYCLCPCNMYVLRFHVSMFHDSGVLFNTDNVLETVKGVEDWWSEGDGLCRGGGLGYWLAVSSEKRGLIQRENADPDVQKRKLIECWREHDFASWHWLSCAVQRVGLTQLASLITTYQHPLTGIQCVHTCTTCTLSPKEYTM